MTEKEQNQTEGLPEHEKQERGATADSAESEEAAPYSLPQIEFAPEDAAQAQENLEDLREQTAFTPNAPEAASESAEEQETSQPEHRFNLISALTEMADTLIERIEPVIAPVEEAIKETVIEPIIENVIEPLTLGSSEAVLKHAPETEIKSTSERLAEVVENVEKEDTEETLDILRYETLPELPKVNRARLQLQSPNRIFLYWSLAGNPFSTLSRAFGNRADNYTLALRLINLSTADEKLFPVDTEGNWWFDVASGASFQVDVGFFAANRPFIKLFSSNQVETPRPAPSQRTDTESDWRVSNVQFARVLDVSGYAQDALPVVFGFDGGATEDKSAAAVLNQLTPNATTAGINTAELRWLLSVLAAGVSLKDVRTRISPELSVWLDAILQENPAALTTENVRSAMQAVFGDEIEATFAEIDKESVRYQLSPVFGASEVHFPEIQFPRLRLPESVFPTSPVF